MKDKKIMPFIKTSDKTTADILLSEGFQLLDKSGEIWTFINDGSLRFSTDKKIVYSDKLTF